MSGESHLAAQHYSPLSTYYSLLTQRRIGADMYTDGMAGIRLKHNLDMHFDNFKAEN